MLGWREGFVAIHHEEDGLEQIDAATMKSYAYMKEEFW